MDTFESTIRAYQKVLSKWIFKDPSSYPESFAISRFKKKMERPDKTRLKDLQSSCWSDFLSFDLSLPSSISLPHGEWYQARILLHEWLRGDFRKSSIDFPKGSSFEPTKGLNSIESRLSRGKWTCTPENFENFSRIVYEHKALKRAFRKRYSKWYRNKFIESPKESNAILWKAFNDPFKVFQWKLERIVSFVRGSRFSTVPKNNKTRRPINIEPFGNILSQRQIGNFLREKLNDQGINLDTLSDSHRVRIKCPELATIDLKNASDSMSLALCKFLLPEKFFNSLLLSRSSLLLGGDGDYHVLKKISSMGNGFTFELMTICLTAVCRTLDPESTVFGDDIIISKKVAPRLITLLNSVGFVVNEEKSFIGGPFRESCGANWHDSHGYIKSFDFLYPESIHDCAMILSKAYRLREYPNFELLYLELRRRTPKSLQGGPIGALIEDTRSVVDEELPSYFPCDSQGEPVPSRVRKRLVKDYHFRDIRSFTGLRYVPSLASRTVRDLSDAWHWGKYEMYLHSNRVSDDIVTGSGSWVQQSYYLIDGRVFRSSAFQVELDT